MLQRANTMVNLLGSQQGSAGNGPLPVPANSTAGSASTGGHRSDEPNAHVSSGTGADGSTPYIGETFPGDATRDSVYKWYSRISAVFPHRTPPSNWVLWSSKSHQQVIKKSSMSQLHVIRKSSICHQKIIHESSTCHEKVNNKSSHSHP